MSHLFIDVIVTFLLFAIGVAWTVFRYSTHDRLVFAAVAILSPVLAILSLLMLFVDALRGKIEVGPCPAGLSEAERMVEQERQRMFGGPLREPAFSLRWKRAYEMELQREAERVQRVAHKVFAHA